MKGEFFIVKITTIDVETTFDVDEDGKIKSSPYNHNMLVSIGYKIDDGSVEYLCFYHQQEPPTKNSKEKLQKVLNGTDILIGHNIKFDYNWLVACNFIYSGKLHDTMVMEYLMARGSKWGFSLEDCCKRKGVALKKTELIQPFIKNKISYDKIPWNIVEEYGRQDVECTYQLAVAQLSKLKMNWGDLYE